MIKQDNFNQFQIINEQKLLKFIEFFESAICKRCWAATYNCHGRPYHNHGGILEIIHEFKLERTNFNKWVHEQSHGFLHGFMTLYFAYCLHPNKDELWNSCFFYNEKKSNYPRVKQGDQFVVSAIMHDFIKTVEENHNCHDKKLRDISENFDPVVYSHSTPSQSDIAHPIIGADRLELMRFSDYSEWCDMKLLMPYIKNYGSINLIAHFFRHIRPVIQKMFLHRNDIWISHILEVTWQPIVNIKDNKGTRFYPKSHWKAEDPAYSENYVKDLEKYFSVNMGTLSHPTCLTHAKPHHGPIGLISLSSLKENSCELKPAPPSTCGRDHPFVLENKMLPISQWSYLYTEESQLSQFDHNDDFHVISKDLYFKLYHVTENFLIKLLALGVK